MKQLVHNGVLIPKKPEWKRLHIIVQDKRLNLTPEQEEIAIAWVKKLGTDYVEDRVFVKNFFKDFRKVMGIKRSIAPEEFNFSPIIKEVEKQKAYKLSLTKEEKKKLTAERKLIREANKERFGFAIVDGIKVEVSNYIAEPSAIFMGRGKHPLRGCWKRGADKNDITINLSPDSPKPPGKWMHVVWKPEVMWIAKWVDKLRGKEKYVWLADSSPLKQKNDIEKFNKAIELAKKIDDVRKHITSNLDSNDVLRRKIASVCYLIDALKLRVGDEKDPDEADTIGATTLRPEHITFSENRLVTFDFLGKDAVQWQKRVRLPDQIIRNIKTLMNSASSSIFEGVNSKNVSQFINEVAPGVSSKVFRTYHASKVVNDFLNSSEVSASDLGYVKKHIATMANLEAAIVCNHKRKPPKNWRESLLKKRERLKKLRAKNTQSAKRKAKILEYKIRAARETKDYNLGTSLKSYIDPRIYFKWGQKVDYDWKNYYPKALHKKFSWIERGVINSSQNV